MKAQKKQRVWGWIFFIGGAIGTWSSLVELSGHNNPIFGDASSHEPGWVAAEAVLGIIFLVSGALWIERHRKNSDE